MFDDKDIKIVGDRPSDTVKIHRAAKQAEDEFSIESANGNLDRARALGKAVAEKFCEAGNDIMPDGDSADNTEMLIQRQQLLAFGVILQRAAAHSLCSHTCALRRVFCHVHAAAKNGFDLLFAAGGETLRGD